MKQLSLLMSLALAALLPSCGGSTTAQKTLETKQSTTEVVQQERTSGVFQDDIDFDMDDFNEDLK